VAAKGNEQFVVFVVGMRINKLWAIHQWLPVAAAMPSMVIEQIKNRSIGVVGIPRTFVSGRLIQVQQYWKSYEELENYSKGARHAPAWSKFNKAARKSAAVGIYHETYEINKSGYEAIYVNVEKPILLGDAIGIQELENNSSSRKRIYGDK
jgi:hypothetical protein